LVFIRINSIVSSLLRSKEKWKIKEKKSFCFLLCFRHLKIEKKWN